MSTAGEATQGASGPVSARLGGARLGTAGMATQIDPGPVARAGVAMNPSIQGVPHE